MQSDRMEVDRNTASSRGVGRGRGGFNLGQRGGSQRSVPYNTSRSASAPSASSGNKWKHDLFGRESDLYAPALNPLAFPRDKGPRETSKASPSLRPFGESTTAWTSTPVTFDRSSSSGDAGSNGSSHLLSRVKGLGSEAAERQRREAERRKRLDDQRAAKLKADAERRAAEARKQAEADRAMQLRIAEQEERGHVVQVEGLVFGTSAEDVQTAFGAYGETSFCFIVNEASARESDSLVARLTFKLFDDAETACSKLNGAIADGKPLHVTRVERTPFPHHSEETVVKGAVTAGPPRTAARVVSNGTAPSRAPAPATNPAPLTRRMYADKIEQLDPRAQTIQDNDLGLNYDDADTNMELDAEQSHSAENDRPGRLVGVPQAQGARWANSGRGGTVRGGGRGGRGGQGAAPRMEPKPLNLLDRMNGSAQAQNQGQRPQAQQQQAFPGRPGGNVVGQVRGGGASGGSLLNRLK